jgi:photosystem II stability/assembly factor-like uncharacterized protein
MRSMLLSFFLIALLNFSVTAQTSNSVAEMNSSATAQIPENTYSAMRWRLVGPFRAGWGTVAEGIPNEPNTFYFGSAGGGVWKTIDAGQTWQPLLQHETASSIGGLALAPSNPKIIYAGTGQVTMRYDVMAGEGVFRSDDGGETWKNVGLKETRHIGRILVDQNDPNRVLVAAMGHAFEANPERGVYLTTDGGKNWQRVLFVDDKTGAVDLAADPDDSKVVYAALWQLRMHPWLDYFEPQAGPNSGIYKSDDGGEHWQRVKGGGLPDGDLARIGLGVARGSKGQIVYATIVGPKGNSGLYRSNDGGKSWQFINDDPELASNYFSRITVSPHNPEVVYVMDRSIHRSDDGGKHFTIFKGSPGGDDYHFLWINPADETHMITASDQGTVVTVDGGASWSSWYNQPTGQFYHVEADDQFPYRLYSGQQDNGTVGIWSRGPYGVIEERDWHPVGGDERDYMVPKPGNPEVVFGSGLGGYVSRFDETTRQVTNVSPWPVSSYGARPAEARYHYTWISPLAFSPVAPHALYFGAQVLFRSLDDGDHWDIVSPDLSGKNSSVKDCQNLDLAGARACGYGVIYSIAPSPLSNDIIWVGTDDGLIQLTTDNSAHWRNVTPNQVPLWGRVTDIAPSPFSPHAAYVAVDLHRLDRFAPLILKTNDDGKTWQAITNGLPADEYVSAVCADPARPGLLYTGTNRSVYVSFDDGANWQSLALNFPTTWVRDLLVHNGDLIAATQGRGIWVLDNLEPLRQLSDEMVVKPVYLFRPATAWRLRENENRDTPPPPSTPLGQNPPAGAMIDYWLKDAAGDEVILTISDSLGHVVRRFSSRDNPEDLPANRYFEEDWLGEPQPLSADAGMHRFVWDLRYPRPTAIRYDYSIAAVWREGVPLTPQGPLVLPGRYTVSLKTGGTEYSQPLVVKLDPRVHVNDEALRSQLKLALSLNATLERAVSVHEKITNILKARKSSLSKAMADSFSVLTRDGKPSLASVAGVLTSLNSAVQSADAVPTQGQQSVFAEYQRQLDGLLDRWRQLEAKLPPEEGTRK